MAILFFIISLGINLYFYYIELLDKIQEVEGFAISQPGIITDNSNNFLNCDIAEQYTSGGICMDLSYVDQNGVIQPNNKFVIYSNYYVDPASGVLQPVPYGYIANPQHTGYYAISTTALIETSNNQFTPPPSYSGIINPETTYNPTFVDVSYNTLGEYTSAKDNKGLPPGKMWFPNKDGTASIVDIDTYDQSTHYYELGTYSIGARNYLPNYERSSYISSLGSQNIQDYSNKDPIYLAGAPVINTSYTDIATRYAHDAAGLEAVCNSMDINVCASSTSCALLGGQKCVSADKNGPIMKSNYSDFLIMNRDYYYYQGECYGMCPGPIT